MTYLSHLSVSSPAEVVVVMLPLDEKDICGPEPSSGRESMGLMVSRSVRKDACLPSCGSGGGCACAAMRFLQRQRGHDGCGSEEWTRGCSEGAGGDAGKGARLLMCMSWAEGSSGA